MSSLKSGQTQQPAQMGKAMTRLDGQDTDAIARRLAGIAVEAGRVLQRMEAAAIEQRVKVDGTPTSAADLAAEDVILARLAEAWPGIPVVAEETASDVAPDEYFFLV